MKPKGQASWGAQDTGAGVWDVVVGRQEGRRGWGRDEMLKRFCNFEVRTVEP